MEEEPGSHPGVSSRMFPRLSWCYCCCCPRARARAALLAPVTVPVTHRRGMAGFVAGAAQKVGGWKGKEGESEKRKVGEGETGWGWGPGRLGWQPQGGGR